jgi:glycerol-3-phosphate dehydrogenase (NAD(P)+)
MSSTVTVLGGGSWGTALAVQLARNGHSVRMWDRNPDRCDTINREHRNPRYLSDVDLPHNLVAEPDLERAVSESWLVVPVVPSHALRGVIRRAAPFLRDDVEVCCATKGIEVESLDPMCKVLEQELDDSLRPGITVLSGPSFAAELARGLPTTFVIAGDEGPAERAADAFHGGHTRVYHTDDVIGVSVGGSLKNVMAIGCGMSDGLGLGLNARAALITRGLDEITRVAVALGAKSLTMMGLAGMGDLVLTCTGNLSRNRRVGLALGEGRTLDDILEELGEVAEGVITSKSAHHLGEQLGIELPITEQVYSVIHQGKSAKEGFGDLMGRQRKHERHAHDD